MPTINASGSPTASTPTPTTTPQPPTDQSDLSEELLTVAEVAALLKCDEEAVYNLTRARSQARSLDPVPCVHMQVGLRFSAVEIKAWIKRQRLAERAAQRARKFPTDKISDRAVLLDIISDPIATSKQSAQAQEILSTRDRESEEVTEEVKS
jgi:hypothetical protein